MFISFRKCSPQNHTQFQTIKIKNLYPFSDQNGSQTIPFGAAHTYIILRDKSYTNTKDNRNYKKINDVIVYVGSTRDLISQNPALPVSIELLSRKVNFSRSISLAVFCLCYILFLAD